MKHRIETSAADITTTKKSMKKAILYARVSTHKQAEKDLSLPAQIEQMRTYCKEMGWSIVVITSRLKELTNQKKSLELEILDLETQSISQPDIPFSLDDIEKELKKSLKHLKWAQWKRNGLFCVLSFQKLSLLMTTYRIFLKYLLILSIIIFGDEDVKKIIGNDVFRRQQWQ